MAPMQIFNRPFNLQRFLMIILVALIAAYILMALKANPQKKQLNQQPSYFLHLVPHYARGIIVLNDITIARFNSTVGGTTHTIALTPWLVTGKNKLYVTAWPERQNTNPEIKAVLQASPDDKPGKLLLDVKQHGMHEAIIEIENMPEWQWMKGEATIHDVSEIRQAVKRYHAAYERQDFQYIDMIEAPLFQDMEILTGLKHMGQRSSRRKLIEKAELLPLPQLTIRPFAAGKIMAVTSPDGQAPIVLKHKYGTGGMLIRTGKYWSKLDGVWKVVR